MSIRIAVTNVVPMGSIALPKPGASHPTSTPVMTITQKYSCRYHFGGCAGFVVSAGSAVVVLAIVPTSLSESRARKAHSA